MCGKSAVLILGGGSPKNFILQTEPQIQEIMGLDEKGHDYFVQITDARADTGGLSGATPSEAMTWGKVDPSQLPDTIVCYTDTTIALPIMTALLGALQADYLANSSGPPETADDLPEGAGGTAVGRATPLDG